MPHLTAVITPINDSAELAAIIAATQCWLERAIIGLNLCPFAKAVHVKKQIRYAVSAAQTADELLAELEHELQLLAETPPDILDTTLLIHPQVMGDSLRHFHFLSPKPMPRSATSASLAFSRSPTCIRSTNSPAVMPTTSIISPTVPLPHPASFA